MTKLRFRFPISPSGIVGLATQVRVIKETRKALDPTNLERITRPKRKQRLNQKPKSKPRRKTNKIRKKTRPKVKHKAAFGSGLFLD
jgi:hypothetical protein